MFSSIFCRQSASYFFHCQAEPRPLHRAESADGEQQQPVQPAAAAPTAADGQQLQGGHGLQQRGLLTHARARTRGQWSATRGKGVKGAFWDE